MKKLIPHFALTAIVFIALSCGNDETSSNPDSGRPFESYENDPLGLRVYTLENGLTVYLSVNKDEPRIETAIAVKAGSKNDPSDATGLAHYLEHMVFKGTSKLAALNWAEEKPLLEKISALYEEHRNTQDSEERKAIYKRIDSLSFEASKLAATNEYDKMIKELGGEGSNAYTFLEQTVYTVNIPSNELSRWIALESERFNELVLRIFHTELEAVYEEFNQGQDSDYRKNWAAMTQALFKKHNYGTQTTIGTAEHLKNPSMVKIHEYFDTYYVPNNMAICISGDFNPDSAIAWIDKAFGGMKSKKVPEFTFEKEEPITEPIKIDITGPMSEWIDIGFRFDGYGSKDIPYLRLLDYLLTNGQAGVLDLNLIQSQAILDGESYYDIYKDYSIFGLTGYPRAGQKLEDVETLLLAQLDSVKEGKFEDWLIEAVANDLEFSYKRGSSDNYFRVDKMVTSFVQERDYQSDLGLYNQIREISKADLIAFVKKNFNTNHVSVYKRTGKDPNTVKVEKPEITAIQVNRDEHSEYFNKLAEVPSGSIEPLFIDFKKDVHQAKIAGDLPFYHTSNKNNDIFTLFYALDMGTRHDRKLGVALDYLEFLGTSKYTPQELKKEMFRYGLSFGRYTSDRRTYISMTGLDKNLDKGVELMEHILSDVKGDKAAYQEVIQGMAKNRNDAMQNKSNILYVGLRNYANFGDASPVIDREPIETLLASDGSELIDKIKSLTSYPHYVYYHGSKSAEEVTTAVNKVHKAPKEFLPYPELRAKPEKDNETPSVFFTNYDMVQTQIIMTHKGPPMDKKLTPYAAIFGEYFGLGFTSIVYQEIRESRALAYSAYARFSVPSRLDRSHYTLAFVGTQNDKMAAAIDAMLEILNVMPESEASFKAAKESAMKSIESSRITGSNAFWHYQSMKDIEVDYDMRQDTYKGIEQMTFEDFKTFFYKNIATKNFTFLVIGDESQVDFKALNKLGPVKKVTSKDLYTY